MKENSISNILMNAKKIAIVGLSSNENRPSNMVALYLQKHGYKIIPVNPNESTILGEICYKSITDIDEDIDIVTIFRRSEHVLPVAKEAIVKGIKLLWMQSGIVNEEAYQEAIEAGIEVVMDKCIKIEHQIRKI